MLGWAVLDEAVLRRRIGGPTVMSAQLDRLAEAAELPNVTLQVLPYAAGEHAALEGSFTILGFSVTPRTAPGRSLYSPPISGRRSPPAYETASSA